MRVMLLYNPIAGSGRAAKAAEKLRDPLRAAGHEPVPTKTSLDPQKQWLDPQLADFNLVVVVGGDGAMRLASGAASRTGTPVYHFPVGTENLFAREFGKDRSPDRLRRAIERFEVRQFDLGIANTRKFLLMASVGIDADVVHDLSRRRTGHISHWSYVAPILRQFRSWSPPRLTVVADGKPIVEDEPGMVIVANSRQYGQHFDPACRASMTDGKLDVVFFPIRGKLDLLRWVISCRLRRHVDDERLIYRLATEVAVRPQGPKYYQLDGDPPELHAADPDETAGEAGATSELSISLRPGVLPVLIP
jgi:diacylglycerol kinase (ATP)